MVFFHSKSKGVTLVELSIVLAIFGILIIVGISGRALIDISRTNATMQYLNHRSIAFQTFETTYDCLPGDCAKDLTQINVTVKGDGDTIIELADSTAGGATAAANNELAFVEEHFVKAKLFNRTITPTIVASAQGSADNLLSGILPIVKIPSTYVSTFTIVSKN
jgi:prepilin-type N-terminal cleavage/methylation domain-containing protein